MNTIAMIAVVLVGIFLIGFILWRVFKKKDKPVHTYGKGGGGTTNEKRGPLETKI